MKKFLLLVFILLGLVTSAQIVNIPDPVFKNVLVNYTDILGRSIDTNHDGEIQVSEAASYSSLAGSLFIPNMNISDLTGIKAFVHLEMLYCGSNHLTSLDVSDLPIRQLFCSNNNLTSLNVTGCGDFMLSIDASDNNLTSIDLAGLYAMKWLILSNNNLTSLNLSDLSSLETLGCDHNQLTTLDVSHNPVLGLNCSYNQLASLNLKNGIVLNEFNNYINLNCEGNPALHYVCADDGEALFLFDYFVQNGMTNTQVDSTCTFSASSGYGSINGIARMDWDNNGCALSDPVKPGVYLKIFNDNDTIQNFHKNTDAAGEYTFYTYDGDFSVVPSIQNPYYTISPDTLHFTTAIGTVQNFDFCIAPNGSHNDLDIKIDFVYAFGDSVHLTFKYRNKGTTTLSGSMQMDFDDNKMDFINAYPEIANQTTGNLLWNFTNLQPLETRQAVIVFHLLPDPINHVGDTLTFTANIDAGADETPSDNTFILQGPINYVLLPVTMEYFKGHVQAGKHYLTWKASCTSLEAKFDIEKSTDTRNFNSIGKITASNTRCLQPFDFIDNNPAAGINYYRIKMTDVDGKSSYSSIVALLNKKAGFEIVNLTPNPVSGGNALLNISSAEKRSIHITVIDAAGKAVQIMDQDIIAGFTQLNMNFAKLAAGIYTVTIYSGNEKRTTRFVKQ